MGRRPGVLPAPPGREGARRLLLRVRRQVPPGVDARARGRAVAARSADRLRARRTGLPGRRRRSADARRRAVQRRSRGRSRRRASTSTSRGGRTRRSTGSSTCRPFELASAGAAIVSNPHSGHRAVVRAGRGARSSSRTPTARSRRTSALLDDPAGAAAMGARARERVLDEHTYAHRAASGAAAARARVRGAAYDAAASSRSSPRFDEEGAIGARRGGDPRVRPGDRRRRGRRRLDGRDGRECGRRRRAVVRLPFNLGIGAAVQTGFRYALEHGYDVAVRLDGDGQHDPLPSCRSCSSRSRGTRRTSSPARGSGTTTAATGHRWRAASGSRGSRGSSRCSRASA